MAIKTSDDTAVIKCGKILRNYSYMVIHEDSYKIHSFTNLDLLYMNIELLDKAEIAVSRLQMANNVNVQIKDHFYGVYQQRAMGMNVTLTYSKDYKINRLEP